MEYKVGDWILVEKNSTPGCQLEKGCVDEVIKIFKNEKFLTVRSLGRNGGDVRFTDIRLALPHEIPGYIPPPESYKYLTKLFKKLKIK